MIPIRPDYASELAILRASRRADRRALGDNFQFEENVGSDRQADFEGFAAIDPGLRAAAGGYFFASVQGTKRDHTPSTFSPMNTRALLPSVEPVQKIARLECIDDLLPMIPGGFAALDDAIATANAAVLAPLIRAMNGYEGARPAFACFKAEIADDLRQPDWLSRYIARLGLGHHACKSGTHHFLLMEYTAAEVLKQSTVPLPFAIPTVLEAPNSAFFFPAPAGSGYGYTVDLVPPAASRATREILHIRLAYRIEHIAKAGTTTAPLTVAPLAAARDGHLHTLRARTGRSSYGEPMSPHVDP